MIKFEQIGEWQGDIVTTILQNRGIENMDLFLKPDTSSDTNPFEIENLLQGVQVVSAHLAVNSSFVILVDADADGFLSASILIQYLKRIDPYARIEYIIHENKAHGLTDAVMDKISDGNYDIVIIPDAASNDNRQISLLYAMGMEVVVLDHHIIEETPECGLIINPQLNDKANKNLVGAGVTLKFCQAMDYNLKANLSADLIDLAAVGQIADSSDISENEIRNLVMEGLKNINNKFLKEVLKQKELLAPVPHDLSFSAIPLINAVIRVGTLEEKEMLFRAINDINPEVFTVEKKKKNKTTNKFDKIQVKMNLQQYAVDIATKCKSRQDSAVKKYVAELEKNIWNEGGIAIGKIELEEQFSSLTGLIATKMMNKVQKPVLVLREQKNLFTGSGRGYEPTMSSLKNWCQGTGLFKFAQGHDQAFGIGLPKEKLELLKLQTKLVTAREFVYNVDFVSYGDVSTDVIYELERFKYIFGGKVHDPLFAYVNIEFEKKDIRAKGTVLSFFKNGVEFVMYGTTPEFQEKFTEGFQQEFHLDFVGRPGVNNWLGKESPQIVIEAVDFTSEKDMIDNGEITEFNIIF